MSEANVRTSMRHQGVSLVESLGESLIRRAEERGEVLDSFVAEWARFCADVNESPTVLPHIVLQLGDIDRYCGNKHGPKELNVEQQAFIRHRNEARRARGG